MRKEDVERSIAGLDEQLRDALLLSTKYTFAEVAKHLNIEREQLVQRVDEAKRTIIKELLGDWQDSESMFLVEMHIDAVAMEMQRRRMGVLYRMQKKWLPKWLQSVGQTATGFVEAVGELLQGRQVSVPIGAVATIALIVVAVYIGREPTGEVPPVEYASVGLAPLPDPLVPAQRASAGDEVELAPSPAVFDNEGSCDRVPGEDSLSWQQKCNNDLIERVSASREDYRNFVDDTWPRFRTQWDEMSLEARRIELEARRIELEERRIELEERRIELEEQRIAAEHRNIELEGERKRLEERFRGRPRGLEYEEAFENHVESWNSGYKRPLDRYLQGMEKYREEIKRNYMCEMLALVQGDTDPVDNCSDIEM